MLLLYTAMSLWGISEWREKQYKFPNFISLFSVAQAELVCHNY